jgi:hypothetical protein
MMAKVLIHSPKDMMASFIVGGGFGMMHPAAQARSGAAIHRGLALPEDELIMRFSGSMFDIRRGFIKDAVKNAAGPSTTAQGRPMRLIAGGDVVIAGPHKDASRGAGEAVIVSKNRDDCGCKFDHITRRKGDRCERNPGPFGPR